MGSGSYTTLNIGAGSIRLLSFRGRRVHRWGSAPLAPGLVKDGLILRPKVVAAVIAGLFRSTGAPAERVIASLNGLSFVYRILELPRLDAAAEGEAIRRAARQEMPLPPEELYLSWQTIKVSREELELFVLGVPRRPVDSLAETLAEAGIKLSEVELNPLALARLADRENAIIVSLEPDCFDIVIVAGGMPVVMHSVTPASERASLDDNMRRLLDELTKTIEFYGGSHPRELLEPDTPLLLTGELAGEALSSGLLAAEMPYPVSLLAPPLELPKNLPSASFTANIGLALKMQPLKTAGRRPGDVNLDILTGEKKALARHFRPSYMLLSLAVVVILGLLFPVIHLRSQAYLETGLLQTELNTASQEMEQALADAERAAGMKARLEETLAALSSTRGEQALVMGSGGDFAAEIKLVTDALPDNADFTAIHNHDGGLSVEGVADNPYTVVEYVVELEELGRFPEVRIASIDYPQSVSGNVTVTLDDSVIFDVFISREA